MKSNKKTDNKNKNEKSKQSSYDGINKKQIILASCIAGFLVLCSITAVIYVVLSYGNNETAATEAPSYTEYTDEEPVESSPVYEHGYTPTPRRTPEPASEPAPLDINPIHYFEMSDNLLDYTFVYDGDVFQLPMTLDVFRSYGWETETDLSGTIIPGDTEIIYFNRMNKKAMVYLANLSSETRRLSEATVYCLKMEYSSNYNDNIAVELPKGITRGSAYDDVIAAFGEPNSIYEFANYDGDDIKSLSYFDEEISFLGYPSGVKIVIYNGFAEDIEITNKIQLPSDLEVEVSTEITGRELNYSAPDELGNELLSFNIEIDGDLYTLPSPVSAFLDNGWEIYDNAAATLAARTNKTGFRLERDGCILRHIDVMNISDNLMYIENCFVTGVYSLQYDDARRKAVFTLPGGITVGTPEEKVSEIGEGILEKKYYSDYESWYYEYTVSGYSQKIKIDIDKDTKLVSQIEVHNRQ